MCTSLQFDNDACLVGAKAARPVVCPADVSQAQLRAGHLQGGAQPSHPPPYQQLPKGAGHATPKHACKAAVACCHDVDSINNINAFWLLMSKVLSTSTRE